MSKKITNFAPIFFARVYIRPRRYNEAKTRNNSIDNED